MTLGEKIKSARERKFLTQKQLADKVGISRVQLNYYENDKSDQRFMTISCIATVLNISLDYLAWGNAI